MSVTVHYACDGCDATAKGTERLRWEFRSFSGRDYGFGHVHQANDAKSVAPEGWVACDPYTYCCYCPKCWASIIEPEPGEGGGDGE